MAENRRFSRIPMAPPSAAKPSHYAEQQSLRMSVAPGARAGPSNMRQSVAGGLAPLRASAMGPPGSVSRPSVFRTNTLGQSTGGAAHLQQTPMGSSTARRGSVMPPRNALPLQSAPSGFTKDPRALRDKETQRSMWDSIIQWLRQTSFDTQGLKLSSITAQSFRGIFEHLILSVDEDYYFTPAEDIRERGLKPDAKEKSKWELEFTGALTWFGYPFINSIDVKWLATPSAPYSWPSLLAALHWLSDLGKSRIAGEDTGNPAFLDASRVPEVFDDDIEDYHMAIMHEYIGSAYTAFLVDEVEDDYPEQDRQLQDRYEAKNVAAHKELAQNSRFLEELQNKRGELLRSKPDLDKLQKDYQMSATDNNKYATYYEHLESRTKKVHDQMRTGAIDLQRKEEDLASIRAELLRSQQVVKEQNMSADEVIRMNTEYDSLSQNVNEAGRKAQDGRNAVSSLEVAVANRGGRAEEVVDAYNDKLLALQLVDAAPDGTTLTLELNTASSTPDMILGGPDLRKVVKPALNRAAEQRRLEKAKLESEKLSVDHVLDKLTTDCDSEQEVMDVYIQETTQLTEHTNSIRERMEDDREINDRHVEQYQRDIAQAKHAAQTHGMGAKARLQALEFARQEQVEKTDRLLDQTLKDIMKHTQTILESKSETVAVFDRLLRVAQAS